MRGGATLSQSTPSRHPLPRCPLVTRAVRGGISDRVSRHRDAAHARDGQGVSREALHAGAARGLFQDLHAMAAVLTHGKAPLHIDDNTDGSAESSSVA